VTSLDRFDGIRFLRSASPPGITRLDLPPRRLDRGVRTGTVSVAGLRSRLLVGGGGVALGARWLGSGTPALRREADGTVAAPRTVGGGGIYQVSTYVPRATPARLRAAPRGFPRVYLPYAQFELPGRGASGLSHPNLLLEEHSAPASGALIGPADPGKAPGADATTAARIADSPYGGMYALAQRLAHGAHSSYEVARRIQLFLLRSYGYSEHVARARYPLEAFLFSQGAGYCQQFSGAMTLMLRMEGIPARVGAGFKPSVYDARTGGWQVRALDAHAWVEVFFTGFGWVTFDPTPSTPSIRAPGEDAISKALIVSGSSPRPAHGSRTGAGFARARAARAGGQFPLLGALLGGAGLLVLAALGSAAMLSHARLRRGLCGEADGAVAELRRALGALARGSSPARRRPMPATRDPGSLLGQPPPPTLAALERRLRERGRDSAGDYLAALGRSRYAPPGGGPAPSPRGRAALRRALTAGAGWRTRLRVLALMPPGGARRDGR
jgi:transglutaminase-like putative cysteine protease